MSQRVTYSFLSKYVTVFILVSSLLVSMTPFVCMLCVDLDTIEISPPFVNDSDGNVNNIIEEDVKMSSEFELSEFYFSLPAQGIFNYLLFSFNFHPEIPTPPPERIQSFSKFKPLFCRFSYLANY